MAGHSGLPVLGEGELGSGVVGSSVLLSRLVGDSRTYERNVLSLASHAWALALGFRPLASSSLRDSRGGISYEGRKQRTVQGSAFIAGN
jgi:hypothetical protein